MKCNIDDLVNNIKNQLGDVNLDELLSGCLGNNNNNSIHVNNDFYDDADLDMFDNDDNGVLVNAGTSKAKGCCNEKPSNPCCGEGCGNQVAPATIGCVQDVCQELAKRIGNVKVTSKFGCACGENLAGAMVILQKLDCCGKYEDVATGITNSKGVCEFGCVETGKYRIVQVIDGRYFNPPCYSPCDTFEITPTNRCINITVINSLNPIAERMLKERQEARRIMAIIEKEKNRAGRNCGRRNNCCKKNNCCGGNETWWVIILLFLTCGCGGFGLGCF